VTATPAGSAWAVGQASGGRTLVLHWNGRAWSRVASPSPGTDDYLGSVSVIDLHSVAAASARDAWAVGTASNGTSPILHWNGTSWRQVASQAAEPVSLQGVAMASARSGWAAGYTIAGTLAAEKTVILHWNGTVWTPQTSPDPGTGNLLLGTATAAAGRAWAVGETRNPRLRPLIARWNGTAWKPSG